MLTHLTHEDIQHLQSVGKDAQAARAEYILRDDQEKVWNHLTSLAGKADSRVDFVLDNGSSQSPGHMSEILTSVPQLVLRRVSSRRP